MAFPHDGKKYKKGESGNPKGRPPDIPELKVLLADVLNEEQNDIQAAKAILMSLRKEAIKGNVRAAELLLDRAYGKAKQTIDSNVNTNISILNIDPLDDSENNGTS